MSKLKAAVVGIGGMGKVHTACYMNNPYVEVIAACSRNPKRLEEFAKGVWSDVVYAHQKLGEFKPKYEIKRLYTDYQDLAEDEDIDLVSICTPNVLHFPQTMKFLEKGKHVLVEKPMTTNAEEAKKMIDKATKVNRKLMVGQVWRFHPDVQLVKYVIKKGLIGKPVKTKGYGIHINWAPGGWFTRKESAVGGALMDMGIHAIDTVRYLLSEPQAKSVFACVETKFGKYGVDDMGIVVIEFDNGTISIIEAGWNAPYAEGGEATTLVYGTKGFARIFPVEVRFKIGKEYGKFTPVSKIPFTYETLYQLQIDHFVECILKDKKPIAPGEIGLEAAKIIDAAYESQRKNEVIKFL